MLQVLLRATATSVRELKAESEREAASPTAACSRCDLTAAAKQELIAAMDKMRDFFSK